MKVEELIDTLVADDVFTIYLIHSQKPVFDSELANNRIEYNQIKEEKVKSFSCDFNELKIFI